MRTKWDRDLEQQLLRRFEAAVTTQGVRPVHDTRVVVVALEDWDAHQIRARLSEAGGRTRRAQILGLVAATLALATDCNPGSSYTTSMAFCLALAVREMHLTPAEALWSATAGGAAALRRTDIGHLGVGAQADFNVLAAPSYVHLAYHPGVQIIQNTVIKGTPL